MIEALSQWLERIILLVLLATFLDVILPNASMQKYVKLIMGLLILLALLTPLMQLFQKDFSPDKLALRIMNFNSPTTEDNFKKIKDYGEKLMKQNQQDTKKYAVDQMESLMKAKVEEQFGVQVKSVKISLEKKEMDKEQEYPVISAVQLVLDKDTKTTSHGVTEKSIEVKPIEPVTINVRSQAPDAAASVSTQTNLPLEQRRMLTDVAQYVAKTWSIDQSQVEARVEGKKGDG
jgi:stage III sporulation protein AF